MNTHSQPYDEQCVLLGRIIDYFTSLVDQPDWNTRIDAVKQEVRLALSAVPTTDPANRYRPVRSTTDAIAWYIHLCSSWCRPGTEPTFEIAQASRVLALFTRLGEGLEVLRTIPNSEERLVRMMTGDRNSPDSALFEMLVALAYRRAGWPIVEFLQETRIGKTPDIRVERAGNQYFVECKRFDRNQYALNERSHFDRIWEPVMPFVKRERLGWNIRITFLEELQALPDDYLLQRLAGLPQLPAEGIDFIDRSANIRIVPASLTRLKERLTEGPIRLSPEYYELVTGDFEPTLSYKNAGESLVSDGWIHDVGWQTTVTWECTAPRAVELKSTHLKRNLAQAVDQIPDGESGFIHLAFEGTQGDAVEILRMAKNDQQMLGFDLRGKSIPWVFCNVFQPSVTPDNRCLMDETVRFYVSEAWDGGKPIAGPLILSDDTPVLPMAAWERTDL